MTDHVRAVIAVVDDDPRVLESLENLFQSGGYDVQTYSSGASLLESDVTIIDCLITDVGMPGMDGFELRERVREERPALPVFMISGRHDLTSGRRLAGQGDIGFFSKPFDGRALLAAVDKALRDAKGGRTK
ncbi:MAG: response regulator [Rhizobiaceae bacterium]|jgi:FixJ family two-component response regulator|nr:MAG: response regulator [Rhizobiaceae bacterium]